MPCPNSSCRNSILARRALRASGQSAGPYAILAAILAAKRYAAMAFLLLWGALPAAQAQTQTMETQSLEQRGFGPDAQGQEGQWNLVLGAGVGIVPDYAGASAYRARLLPFFLASYGKVLFIGPMGVGVNLVNNNGLRAGPIIGFEGGRHESNDAHLHGLGDISPSVTAGFFASYQTGPVRISGSVRQAVTNSQNGLQGLVQLDLLVPLPDHKALLSFGPDLQLANARYTQTWFGVSPVQSAQSGLPVYGAGAGVRDYGVHANASYLYDRHIVLRAFTSVRELAGDAGNSPIVQAKTQATVGIGAAYRF